MISLCFLFSNIIFMSCFRYIDFIINNIWKHVFIIFNFLGHIFERKVILYEHISRNVDFPINHVINSITFLALRITNKHWGSVFISRILFEHNFKWIFILYELWGKSIYNIRWSHNTLSQNLTSKLASNLIALSTLRMLCVFVLRLHFNVGCVHNTFHESCHVLRKTPTWD